MINEYECAFQWPRILEYAVLVTYYRQGVNLLLSNLLWQAYRKRMDLDKPFSAAVNGQP
jgi:hypothetical protein